MISASELRIGNYALITVNVEQVADVDYKETWVSANHISEINSHELLCRGIQLTEEWLVKFGFDSGQIEIQSPRFKNQMQTLTIVIDEGCSLLSESMEIEIDLKLPFFVHQLQNLYHSLTGKELIIHQPTQSL